MMIDHFLPCYNSECDCTINGKKARNIPWNGYCQKESSRHLPRGDYYYLWRRYQDGVETWLCVIWHENWAKKGIGERRGSVNETGSYLREDVEKWAEYTLKRIHHSPETIALLHEDFKAMEEDPDFRL